MEVIEKLQTENVCNVRNQLTSAKLLNILYAQWLLQSRI